MPTRQMQRLWQDDVGRVWRARRPGQGTGATLAVVRWNSHDCRENCDSPTTSALLKVALTRSFVAQPCPDLHFTVVRFRPPAARDPIAVSPSSTRTGVLHARTQGSAQHRYRGPR